MAFEMHQKRWEALNQALTSVQDSIPTDSARENTMRQLLEQLNAFAERQFKFFFDGFSPSSRSLMRSDHFPPEYIFRVLLNQVSFDLDVIQRAISQRQVDSLKSVLRKADNYAFQVLNYPKGLIELPSATTAVTYFQKSISIRVIPYAPVALIGIPFTCVSHKADYMAIPHEVGHYVFRHGNVRQEEDRPLMSVRAYLANAIEPEPAWRRHWLEEVFADVYGCVTSHPFIALDFQNLQLGCSRDYFIQDDGEHPAPVLRPDIYARTLHKQGRVSLAEELAKEWDRRKNKLDGSGAFVLADGSREQIRNAISYATDTAEKPLDQAISQILDLLQIVRTTNDTLKKDALQAHFESTLDDPGLDVGDRLEIDFDPRFTQGNTGTWIDQITQPVGGSELPPEVWLSTLFANGWATKGPDPNPKP